MDLNARLDVDVVAVDTDDEVSVLVDLTAPTLPDASRRPPTALVVVLDRSGSMSGSRLDGARRALRDVVRRLGPADSFGLVTFDDDAAVVVPFGPLSNPHRVEHAIAAVVAGRTTDLSAGYLRGLQEVRRTARTAGTRVLLVSDGHANAGVTDPDRLGQVAAQAAAEGITTTALGFGLDYDETLLAALARAGHGAELFAETAEAAVDAVAGEIDGLLVRSVQAASLRVVMSPHVAGLRVANDLPATVVDHSAVVELGGFTSGERRRLLLTFDVPGIPALGLASIASLELRYVTLPDLVEQTVTLPVHVNVVPGDAAAGRIPDRVVRTEALYQGVQESKRRASRALRDGDAAAGLSALRLASTSLHTWLAAAPAGAAGELAAESAVLDDLVAETTHGRASRASKRMTADAALKSRSRRPDEA
jgi:Ca-activated chloride channel homolog